MPLLQQRQSSSVKTMAKTPGRPTWFRWRSFVVVLIIAGVVVPSADARLSDDYAAGEQLDRALEAVLLRVLASASRPGSLRALVRQATAENQALLAAGLSDGAAACDLDLVRWAGAVTKRETWALQMVDATSKFVTGILYGNSGDLGNFDECVTSTPGTLGSGDDFTGRYALPSLEVQHRAASNGSAATALLQGLQARARSTSRGARGARGAGSGEWDTLVTLQLALCVPSTCSPLVLQAALEHVVGELDHLIAGLGVRLQVSLPAEQTSLYSGWRQADSLDWFVVSLCILLLALVVIGTAIDLALSGEGSERMRGKASLLLAFSAWTNGRRLLTVPPPSDSNFPCINGIRFVSALWVIIGHRYRFALDVPFTNLAIIPKRVIDNYPIMVIPGAILSVDTFFVVGGMMNAYAFLRTVRRRNSFNLLEYYIHRYIRLTPALALMVAITATWISLLGNGPVWYKTAGAANDGCRNNWWAALLYVANYVNPDDQCMMQAWYLMVDMQLHWLSPLVLVPLWKTRRVGVVWVLILILVSCGIPFGLTFVYDFRAPVPLNINDPVKQQLQMDTLYYPTHMRATSYLVGTLAGYMLYMIKTGQSKRRITSFQVGLGWLTSTVLCLTVIFGAQPFFNFEETPYNQLASAFYIGFSRLGWGIGIAWVVLACITGHGAPVNAILSWTPLIPLGRLTYGIYLTHAAVQIVDEGTIRTSDYYSDFKMVERMFSDACLATIFGTVLCLTLESPITALEKSLKSGGHKPRRKDEKVENTMATTDQPQPPSASNHLPNTSNHLQGQDNPAFQDIEESNPSWQLPRVRLHSSDDVV